MLPPFGDDDTLFEHFRQIAAATRCSIVLHGQVPMTLLKRLMALESVVAYKEEYPAIYSVDVFTKYGSRLNIFGGGQKSKFLAYEPYGMKAYYSTFSTFAPTVPKAFWSAVEKHDASGAVEVVKRYDVPFFERFSHAFWRGTLEHFGIAKRYLRNPERTFTQTQVDELKTFYRGLNL
jgi:dihydrodipicolinate synthase/N-acetylneuraminate lyase